MPRPAANPIRSMLAGGDRRSIGRADEVAELIQREPKKTAVLLECLWDDNATVVARAANALEKASRTAPQMLESFKAQLLGLLVEARQKELRWQLALIIPRLPLNPRECRLVSAVLQSWLDDSSSIVKTFAMQGLAGLIRFDPALEPAVLDILRSLSRSGTAAMRARGRMLLKRLETRDGQSSSRVRPKPGKPRG